MMFELKGIISIVRPLAKDGKQHEKNARELVENTIKLRDISQRVCQISRDQSMIDTLISRIDYLVDLIRDLRVGIEIRQ